MQFAQSGSSLARAMFASPESPDATSDTLLAFPTQALSASDSVRSFNGRFTLKYTISGSLMLLDEMLCKNNGIVWSSLTDNISKIPPGIASINGNTGVITLRDKYGQVYWSSTLDRLVPANTFGVTPFRVVVTDQGAIEIRGRDEKVYWERGTRNQTPGFAFYPTCEQAAAAYAKTNADAIQEATRGGQLTVTPWLHYSRYGGRDVMNLYWPGPPCY
jgi:hypothetical protein